MRLFLRLVQDTSTAVNKKTTVLSQALQGMVSGTKKWEFSWTICSHASEMFYYVICTIQIAYEQKYGTVFQTTGIRNTRSFSLLALKIRQKLVISSEKNLVCAVTAMITKTSESHFIIFQFMEELAKYILAVHIWHYSDFYSDLKTCSDNCPLHVRQNTSTGDKCSKNVIKPRTSCT